jgi:hypothetical protein
MFSHPASSKTNTVSAYCAALSRASTVSTGITVDNATGMRLGHMRCIFGLEFSA